MHPGLPFPLARPGIKTLPAQQEYVRLAQFLMRSVRHVSPFLADSGRTLVNYGGVAAPQTMTRVFGIWCTSCFMQGIASAWRSGPPGGGISSRRQALRGITSAWHGGPSMDGIGCIEAFVTGSVREIVAVEQSLMRSISCFIDAPQIIVMEILVRPVDIMIKVTCLAFMKDGIQRGIRLMVLRSSAGHMVNVFWGTFMGGT